MKMRRLILGIAAVTLSIATAASAQTADEIVAKYIKTVGGMEKIQATQSLRRSGKFTGGGGFEAQVVQENKRPEKVRQEFTLQGMTGVNAYDGSRGWKIEPWEGKKDAEPLGEDELKDILEAADFGGPLVNATAKGNKIEYLGMDEVEGTDVYKLKVTLKSGDIQYFYMDTDYYVPIKIETKRTIRGAERELETVLGDYKEVNGWYLPHSIESGVKGRPFRSTVTFDKIEANMPFDDSRFEPPPVAGQPVANPSTTKANEPPKNPTPPKKPADQPKPPATDTTGGNR
jgi:outer membrane lipoprotein-sorting protein